MNIAHRLKTIDAIQNEMTHSWNGAFIFGGGAISLMITGFSPLKLMFAVIGVLATIALANVYFNRRTEIRQILNEIKEV